MEPTTNIDQHLNRMASSSEPYQDDEAQKSTVIVPEDSSGSHSIQDRLVEGSSVEHNPMDDEDYVNPKWPRPAPKEWVPFLQSFTPFPTLPLEIRQAIWKATLKPRIIDLRHNATRGFYSKIQTPLAMRLCHESRDTVKYYHSLCFGNIFYEPRIIFNFSLDTLYFDECIGPEVLEFLVSLKEDERSRIQYIAVDHLINQYREYFELGDRDNVDLFKKAVLSMPSLKEFHIVYKIDDFWHEHGYPEGNGPIHLYEEFPQPIQRFMYDDEIHAENEDNESECQELPNSDHLLEGFHVPKSGSLFGWRPTSLPILD